MDAHCTDAERILAIITDKPGGRTLKLRGYGACSENNLFESIAEAAWEISGPFILNLIRIFMLEKTRVFVPRRRRSFPSHPIPGLTAGPRYCRPLGPRACMSMDQSNARTTCGQNQEPCRDGHEIQARSAGST